MALPRISPITGLPFREIADDHQEKHKQIDNFFKVMDEIIRNKIKTVILLADGWIFYELPNGKLVDRINDDDPVDLAWDNIEQFREAYDDPEDYDIYDVQNITRK